MTREQRRALFRLIVGSTSEGAGELPADVRRAALDGADLPGATGELVTRIREAAHLVEGAHVTAAREEGHSDRALYELTVVTSLGESKRRLEAVLELLGRKG
ncbi:MAG TPA: hypothetical protein VF765_08040 [Polyangiaceae bacterium]